MGRSPSRDDSGLKKGPWTPEEDDKLVKYVQRHGHGSWRALPKLAGLNRCGKSCRLRWTNYLRPDIKRGKFSQDEEQTILNLHAVLGNKWSAIATHLPGRTDNEIKNFWNTHLKKKLIQMGFDPMTHRPRTDVFSALPQLIALANLLDTSSWEDQAFRLQSDVVQMARLNQSLQSLLQPLPLPLPPPATDFQNNITTNVPADQLASFGLLNSLKDASSSVLSLLEAPPPSLPAAGFFQDQSMPAFSRLPDLQAPCSVDNWSSVSKGSAVENSPGSSSPWPQQNLSQTPSSAAAPVAETSAMVDSYDGAQMWSELLNDPIFHDIA